jgi:hypothetical protein
LYLSAEELEYLLEDVAPRRQIPECAEILREPTNVPRIVRTICQEASIFRVVLHGVKNDLGECRVFVLPKVRFEMPEKNNKADENTLEICIQS